jgi:hypothetical protein
VLLSLWPNYWDDWELEHKVTFDGENKLISQILILNQSYIVPGKNGYY